MLPIFSIIFQNGTTVATGFFSQPIDVILLQILLAVGWVPIFMALVWGFGQIWLDMKKDQFKNTIKWILLAVDVPRLTEQSPKAMENVFAALHGTAGGYGWKDKWVYGAHGIKSRFSFEIVSDGGYIQFYIRCADRYRDLVEASIYAQYPDAEISQVEDYVHKVPSQYPNEHQWNAWGTEMRLKQPTYFPVRTWSDFEHNLAKEAGLKDPLGVLLEQLSRFQNGEQLWIQIVMEAGGQEWKDQAETYIKEQYGQKPKAKEGFFDLLLKAIIWLPSQVIQALTTDQINLSALFGYGPAEVKKDEKPPNLTILQKNKVEAVAAKAQKIGLHCKIRVLYFGKTSVFRKGWRVSMIKAIFQQYTKQDTNNFTLDKDVTPQDDYFWLKLSYDRRTNRLVQAYKNRDFAMGAPSCVLNTEELATMYHFPTIDIKAPSVKKTESRRAEPPVGLPMAMEGEPDLPERPSPLIPFGQEDENASAFDIFEESAQMSPIISLPPLQAKREETVFAWEQPQQKKEFPPESPSAKEESLSIDLPPLAGQTKFVKVIPSPVSLPTPPQEKKISTPKRRIPDAMRVLLEPGVELEDVGLSDMASDETDDSPKNLPL